MKGPITRGKFTAYPKGVVGENGHWEVRQEGSPLAIANVTAAEFAIDGEAMLEAYAAGKVFNPSKPFAGERMSAAKIEERRHEILEHGGDCTQVVSEWTRYLAATEAREGGMFNEALAAHDSEQWPALVREFFGALYDGLEEKVEAEDRPAGVEWFDPIHDAARGLEQWDQLKGQAAGDPWACGLAAARVATALEAAIREALKKAPPQDPQRLEEQAQTLEDLAPGSKQAEQAREAAQQAQAQAQELAAELGGQELGEALAQAMEQGVADAVEELEGIAGAMHGLGAGMGPGTLAAVNCPDAELRQALATNPKLRAIAEVAGRMRMRARTKQKTKTRYVPEQIVDVTVGDELARLVPSELALLVLPQTKTLLKKKLHEKQALQYELEGTEQAERGPVVMCVDGSGSMAGLRNVWAMGVALAVLEVCALQRRPFVLVHFDDYVQKEFEVAKPRGLTLDKLIEMVCFFSNGGTNFERPLRRAREIIQRDEWSKADVVLVSDGQASWGNSIKELKDAGAATYGIAIGAKFSGALQEELAGYAEVTDAQIVGGVANVDVVFGI